jgi:hypothetical protein
MAAIPCDHFYPHTYIHDILVHCCAVQLGDCPQVIVVEGLDVIKLQSIRHRSRRQV